jgi:HSP20 family protein
MALMRYTPKSTLTSWPDLDLLTNRLSRAFGSTWDSPEPTGTWIPAVNVEESADELLLTAELPGMSEGDVNVDIENNILTIRGEKREEHEEGGEGHKYHVWERRYGSFQRAFTLPQSVQTEAILADFSEGILTVRMPKSPSAMSRTIEIGGKKK